MRRSLAVPMISLGAIAAIATLGGASFVACSNNSTGNADMAAPGDVVGPAHGNHYQYAVNKILVPMSRSDYAIDLNGDGHVDNQLGNIIGALAAQNFDVQSQLDTAITGGSIVLLVDVQTTANAYDTANAAAANDSVVGVTFYLGVPMKPVVPDGGNPDGGVGGPDFSGMGMFTVDSAVSSTGYQFFGQLVNGVFKSNNPVTTANPTKITVQIALVGGDAAPVNLNVNGAQVQFNLGADMTTNQPGLIGPSSCSPEMTCAGELHGSIRNDDVQMNIIPAVADLLNKQIAKNPNSPTSKQVLQLFDTGDGNGGNCMSTVNGKVVVGKPMDGMIAPCEVADNNIIMNVLAPDVQIYSDSQCTGGMLTAVGSKYGPQASNACRDSLSLGLGFTAVKASFAK